MEFEWVLVSDTNIWVDLQNGDILSDIFRLPYRLIVPELAILELISPKWEILQSFGLEYYELSSQVMQELFDLTILHKRLSATDLASFLLARELAIPLLTGDKRLKELAKNNHIPVYGILWLLDEMIRFEVISKQTAAEALSKMLEMGARLPKDECEIRLSNWNE